MNALDSEPVKALTEEVERFKATNRFTPMLVTGFYMQAGIVLNILAATQVELDSADKVIANLRLKADALSEAAKHLVKYRGGGYPEDVVDACEEWHDADQFIESIPALYEMCEGLDTLEDVIRVLWNRLQEAEAAKLSPMGQKIARHQKQNNPLVGAAAAPD